PILAEGSGVAVYESKLSGTGELYYRRQQRGQVRFGWGDPQRPLTFACHDIVDALEGDRDRRDLAPKAVAYAVGKRLEPDALGLVLSAMEGLFRYGHEALSGLLAAAIERKLTFTFRRGWLARTRGKDAGLAELAERQGYKFALADFAEVGMPTVRD